MSAYKKSLPPKPPPLPDVRVYKPVTRPDQINPALLSKAQREKLWQGIQRDNPALATMLKTDPIIKGLKDAFDAQIIFDKNEASAYAQE